MDKTVLAFVNKLEGYKTAIKQLHWDAKNMSQHELCDDIAESIAEFQDTVSEVEQSITGKLKINSLNPTEYKIKDLKSFVQDVLDATNTFYKAIKDKGDTYVGMASDCESFLSDMQRKLYLVNFTVKEEFKREFRAKINESMPKNLANHDEVDKFMGRRPKTMKARINQIYRIVKRYGIDSKLYHDDHWQAKDDYYRAITSLGCEFEMRPCGNSNNLDNWDDITSDGGYCDYAEDGMPRSKQYAVKIMYDDGMNIGGYIKFMAAGRVDDPFSAYDTCMILWPKSNRVLESRVMRSKSINEDDFMRRWFDKNEEDHLDKARKELMNRDQEKLNPLGSNANAGQVEEGIRLTEAELKQLVKEAATKILSETPLNYDIDNFSGRWTKPKNWNIPNRDLTSGEEYIDDEGYLDDPYKSNEIEDALKDDEWEWGKDMDLKGAENYYSWDRFDGKPIAQGLDPYYKVGKGAVGREVDDAISRRNRENDWSDRELRHGDRVMDKYVHGKYDGEDVGDAWDDLHYESKKPMKVTEQELKQVVKEAATKLIREYGENVKNFVKRSGCAARRKTGDPRKDKENREKWLERQRKRELKGVSKETDESIDIKPSKEGTFTAAATKHGKSVQGFASQVLNNKDDYSPAMVKKANFARNSKKWNKK